MPRPSLYDILYGNFAGGLDLNTVSETDQHIARYVNRFTQCGELCIARS